MTLLDYINTLSNSPQLALIVLALTLAGAYGLANLVTSCFPPTKNHQLAIPLKLVLGLDLAALLELLCAKFILTAPIVTLWSTLILLSLYGFYRLGRDLGKLPNRPWLITICALFGLYTLGSALCLPYAWDEQTYQAALITQYLERGSVAVLPDNPYSALASMNHFILLLPFRLGGVLMFKLQVWANFLIILPWLYLLLEKRGKIVAAILTLAVALSPVSAVLNRTAYAESYIILNLLSGLTALRLYRPQPRRLGILIGWFAGMAAAVKLTGMGVSLLLTILYLRTLKTDQIRRLGLFAVGALLGAGPFYLRVLLNTGNPFYPYASKFFAPGNLAASLVELYHTKLGTHLYGLNGIAGVFSGWITAAFNSKIYDGVVLGWQFLLMAIITAAAAWWMIRTSPKRLKWLLYPLLATLALYGFWAVSSQQTRFLYPLLFLAAMGAGWGLKRFNPKVRQFGLIVITLGALLSLFVPGIKHYLQAWKLRTLSQGKPIEFLSFAAKDREYFAMLDYIGENLPRDSKILLIFERRGLYLPRPYEIGTPCFQAKYFTPVPDDMAEALMVIKHSQADYLLIGGSTQDPDYLEEYNEINAKLATLLRELLRNHALMLVEVPDAASYTLLKVNKFTCIL